MRVFLGLSLLIFGCGDAEPAPEQPVSDSALPLTLAEVPNLDVQGHGGASIGPMTERPGPEVLEQVMQDMRASTQLTFELSNRLNNASDWRAMEAAADEILPQLPESVRRGTEANVARRIVHTIVSIPAPTPDDYDALGQYLNEMILLRTPEGDDVLRALIRLDGVWSPEQIAGAARSASRYLGAHFTEQAGCVGCTVEEALAEMLPQRSLSMDPYLYEVQTVHRELVRLARAPDTLRLGDSVKRLTVSVERPRRARPGQFWALSGIPARLSAR